MERCAGVVHCLLHLLCLWMVAEAQVANGGAAEDVNHGSLLCRGRLVGVEDLKDVDMYIVMFETDDQRREAAKALKEEFVSDSVTGRLYHHLIIHGFTAVLTPSQVAFLLEWDRTHDGLQGIECNAKLKRGQPAKPPEVESDLDDDDFRNWGGTSRWSWPLVLGVMFIWHMLG